VPDRKSTIGIIEDHDPLACQRSCDLVRLQDEQHLVVLQRQIFGDRAVRCDPSFQAKASSSIVIAAQSNYARYIAASSSPARRGIAEITLNNPFGTRAEIYLPPCFGIR
jgi:hypothetical protein